MGRDTLERKATRAVIRMDEKISDISNTLYDISMELCHIIRREKPYYETGDTVDYSGKRQSHG